MQESINIFSKWKWCFFNESTYGAVTLWKIWISFRNKSILSNKVFKFSASSSFLASSETSNWEIFAHVINKRLRKFTTNSIFYAVNSYEKAISNGCYFCWSCQKEIKEIYIYIPPNFRLPSSLYSILTRAGRLEVS